MGQRHVCTFRHAQRAAYRTAISAAQILVLPILSVRPSVRPSHSGIISKGNANVVKLFGRAVTLVCSSATDVTKF